MKFLKMLPDELTKEAGKGFYFLNAV